MNVIAYRNQFRSWQDASLPNVKKIKPEIILFDDGTIYDSILYKMSLMVTNLSPWRMFSFENYRSSGPFDADLNDYVFDDDVNRFERIRNLSKERQFELQMIGAAVLKMDK